MSAFSMNSSVDQRIIKLMMAILVSACTLLPQLASGETKRKIPAPGFTQTESNQWINSGPLTLDDLSGNIVLLDIWTYGCGNCRRSIPWIKHLEQHFSDKPFKVIGIHSPEFPWERIRFTVKSQVKLLGITHPVMLDNDLAYWNALHNRFWPSFYIMDADGNLIAIAIGEIHIGNEQALAVERKIQRLITSIDTHTKPDPQESP